ncbi:unnamed protein product, partial [Rotaria sp. Silwood2]
MSRASLCHLFTNQHSLGMWTEFMQIQNNESGHNNNDENNNVETVTLNKKGNSLGLSIVAVK